MLQENRKREMKAAWEHQETLAMVGRRNEAKRTALRLFQRFYKMNIRLMSKRSLIFFAGLIALLSGCRTPAPKVEAESWRGLHVPVFSDSQLNQLKDQLPKLAGMGVNVVV